MKIYLAGPHTYPGMLIELLNGGSGDDFVIGMRQKDLFNKYENIFSGGVSGNLNAAWKRMAKTEITPSGLIKALQDENFFSRRQRQEENNTIYTRGGFSNNEQIIRHRPYILESFYYCDADLERLLPYFGDFLLDSGAFTFMQNSKVNIQWEEYIERYADFINRNNIEKFFELDIDSVVGYKKVLEYRKRLEKATGKQCIPVWHKSRGIEEYKKHCHEYPYISIGGYVIKELKPKDFEAFPIMIRYAHQNNAKVHCLGFTKLDALTKYHFDSVDSTAWTTGNRFGHIYFFDGKTMKKISTPKGKRLADSRKVALINYLEWIKFQQYAESHL